MPYPGPDLYPGTGGPTPPAPALARAAAGATGATVLPRQLAGPTAVGAATRGVPTRQKWPKGSAVDLTQVVYARDGVTPRTGAVVRCTLRPLAGGAPVAAVDGLALADVPDTPGAYRATVPAQTVDALPLGVYVLETLVDPDTPALRQEETGEVEVLEARGVSGLAQPFAVQLAPPRLTATPPVLAFAADQGGPAPAPQRVTLGLTHGTPGARAVAVLAAPGQPAPAWLSATLDGADVVVAATPGALAGGGYAAVVRVSDPVADNSPLDVAVVLDVAGEAPVGPGPSASPGALAFTGTEGGASPAARAVTLANVPAGAALAVISVGGPPAPTWLSASRAGNTVTVSVTLAGLAAGPYAGAVRLTSGADVLDLPVALAVAAQAPAAPYYGSLTAAEPALTLQQPPGPAVRRPLLPVRPPGGVLVLQLAANGITLSADDMAALSALGADEARTITVTAPGPVTAVSLTPAVVEVVA